MGRPIVAALTHLGSHISTTWTTVAVLLAIISTQLTGRPAILCAGIGCILLLLNLANAGRRARGGRPV